MEHGYIKKPSNFKQFTVVPMELIRDNRISFGAKGLFAYFLSHEKDMKITINFIINGFPHGREYINARIKELVYFGYLKRQEVRDKGKFKGYNWTLCEPQTGFPVTVKPDAVKPETVNQHQSNIINKEILKERYTEELNFDDFDDIYHWALENWSNMIPYRYLPKTDKERLNWLSAFKSIHKNKKVHPMFLLNLKQDSLNDEFLGGIGHSPARLTNKWKSGTNTLEEMKNKFGEKYQGVDWKKLYLDTKQKQI